MGLELDPLMIVWHTVSGTPQTPLISDIVANEPARAPPASLSV